MLFSGIDLHKRTVAIHTLDAHGAVVRAANPPTHRSALTAHFGTLAGPHRAVGESRGRGHRDVVLAAGSAHRARD